MPLVLKDTEYHTYSDYLNWPDDVRYELINGEAFLMSPAPDLSHQDVNPLNLSQKLMQIRCFFGKIVL